MITLGHLRRSRGLAALLSTVASLVFLAGFAACLICDVDACCDDADHEDEIACACACAFHSMMVVTGLTIQQYDSPGIGLGQGILLPEPAPPCCEYHPPRA